MSDLKSQLIKLGSTNPELRKDIRPILAALGKTSNRSKVEREIDAIKKFIVKPGSGVRLRSREPSVEHFDTHAYVEFDIDGDPSALDVMEQQIKRRFPKTKLMVSWESHGAVLAGTVSY